MGNQPAQITDAISVGIGKGADKDLVAYSGVLRVRRGR
jgi:hypothetical protein